MTQTIKRIACTSLLFTALSSAPVIAQTADHSSHSPHSGHDMSQMDHTQTGHEGMGHASMNHEGMDHEAMMKMRASHMVEIRGMLTALNPTSREATIRYDAVPSISWPAAEMIFPVGTSVDLSGLTPGQSVQFTLHRAADGSLPLVELCPATRVGVQAGLCATDMDHGSMQHDMKPAHGDHSMMGHASDDPAQPEPSHAHGADK